MKVTLDVEVLDVDDDRPAVRTGKGIRRVEKLGHEAGHLFAAQRTMDLDRRLTGERGADLLPNAEQVRSALFDGSVDQQAEERLDIAAQQLRRHRGDSEGIAGESL